MPQMVMTHDVDPKEAIHAKLGNVDTFDMVNNDVLVAVYKRPEKTKGGIILTDATRDEDNYQSKVGLVVKVGPTAFQDDTGKWQWPDIALGDWVVFRPSDGWNVTLSGEGGGIGKDAQLCRLLHDTSIRAKIPNPDMVW